MIEITKVDVVPELDAMHQDTLGATVTTLMIYPADRRASVTQEYDDGAMTADLWHGRTLGWTFPDRPDEKAVRDYLTGERGQGLLENICLEHSIDWNGHNMVGTLTDEGRAALDQLVADLSGFDPSAWGLAGAEDWLGDESFLEGGGWPITAETTDGRLDEIANEVEAMGRDEWVVLVGVRDYLADLRDKLREEADEAEE